MATNQKNKTELNTHAHAKQNEKKNRKQKKNERKKQQETKQRRETKQTQVIIQLQNTTENKPAINTKGKKDNNCKTGKTKLSHTHKHTQKKTKN